MVAFDDTPASIISAVKDRGLEVVSFGSDDSQWPDGFLALERALGQS